MQVTADAIHKLALKLIEAFSFQDACRRGFERYWPLSGPVEAFSEHAVGELEQEVAKALQNALEAALRKMAPQSFHMDAECVARFLDAETSTPQPYKQGRKALRRR